VSRAITWSQSDTTHLWKRDAASSFWIFSGIFGIAHFVRGKMGLVCEQKVTNCMGVNFNPTAALRPVTHDRTCKMLKALDMIRMLPIHTVLQTHAQNTEADRNSSCASAWTSL
jgi:hypothetical protein